MIVKHRECTLAKYRHADSNTNLYEEFPEIKLTEISFSLASTPVVVIKAFIEITEEICLKKSVEWRRG